MVHVDSGVTKKVSRSSLVLLILMVSYLSLACTTAERAGNTFATDLPSADESQSVADSNTPVGEDEGEHQQSRGAELLVEDNESVETPPVLPLDEYFGLIPFGAQQAAQLAEAEQNRRDFETECMAQAGFAGFVAPGFANAVPVTGSRPFNESLEAIRDRGYRAYILEEALMEVQSGPIDAFPDFSAAFQALPGGDQESAMEQYSLCYGEALQSIGQDGAGISVPEELARQVSNEVDEIRLAIRENSGFESIWGDWSGCMAVEGFDVSDRDDVLAVLDTDFRPLYDELQSLRQTAAPIPETIVARVDEFRAQENVVVSADIGCADQIDLEGRFAGLQIQLEEEAISLRGPRLEALRLELCAYLPADDPACGG